MNTEKIFQEACSALEQSNCKTLVAFSNCPETHDIFVQAAKAGVLDRLPFPTESVTYADCLKLLDEIGNRKTLQKDYRRHYQVIANVDGLLDERYGVDEEICINENDMIPECAFYLKEFNKYKQEYSLNIKTYLEILRERQRLFSSSSFDVYEMNQTFKTKEEAIDYVLLVAQLHGGPKLSISKLLKPEMKRIINMAFYLGCLDELIKNEEFHYNKVLESIRKYKVFKDFKKYNISHYNISSLIDGMLNAFFINYRGNLIGFWKIYENRYLAAKTCTNISEYRHNFKVAYKISKSNNELDDFIWFSNFEYNDGKIKNNLVYAYIDKTPNNEGKPIVYIGRTLVYNRNKRNSDHRRKTDPVFKYFNFLNRDVPDMLILKMNLTLTDSRYYEDYYVHFYRQNNYYVINTAPTGIKTSSIGGGMRYWNYESTYNEAKKYNYICDFQNNSNGAYSAALNKGWLNDYYWLIRKKSETRSYEECYNIAKKYNRMADFCKYEREYYDSARFRGWLDDYIWLERANRNEWSKDKCFEESKKYNTIVELKKANRKLLDAIYKNGWIKDMPWLKKVKITLSDKELLIKASKYKTKKSLKQNDFNLFHVLVYNRKLYSVIYDDSGNLKTNFEEIIKKYE